MVDRIGALLAEHPSLTVVAAVDRTVAADALMDLARRGVSDFLDFCIEDSPRLAAHRFYDARGRAFRARLEGMLTGSGAEAVVLLRAAADVALRGGGATELAAVFGVSPVTAAKWCAAAGLPYPRTLLLWMRLLLAAFLLAEPRRTVASVARHCGYGSDRSLRRALGRLGDGSPSAFRRADAFPTVARAFDAVLFEARERHRERRSRPR